MIEITLVAYVSAVLTAFIAGMAFIVGLYLLIRR